MGKYISLRGLDSVPVTVTVEGVERIGELEAWRQDDAGAWSGLVQYAAPVDNTYTGMHVGWFPADDIRPDDTDYSNGR